MKKYLAILVCKFTKFVLKIIGRGSSFPGKIALKIDKDILNKIDYPKYIIAVTGSNGKTSTVEMINEVLKNAGFSVAFNKEGSNQIEGVASFVLANTSLNGKFKKDVVLIETDERYARHTFKHFSPTHYIITNIYRDQMTRNGHHEWIRDIIAESIKDNSILILNADDPTVSSLAHGVNNEIRYFGIDRNGYSTEKKNSNYDDGRYCPICKSEMCYDFYHFNHIGKYSCSKCGFERKDPEYRITDVNLEDGYLIIDDKYRIDLVLKSIYNAYNILATYSLSKELGIDPEIVAKTLNNYILRNGRMVNFRAGDHKGMLLISKHENSISYNQSLRVVANHKGNATVFLMVDAISRKYFTSETSWLWDIDFEYLQSDNVKLIVLTGQYASDVAERLLYAGVDFSKIHIDEDIMKSIGYLKRNAIGFTYVLTCFSDEKKFLNHVEVEQ